jgi:hypothetical protein
MKPNTKILFMVTAVVEAGTGAALIASPSLEASLLMASSLDTAAGLTIGRVAGAGLFALGLACWLARNDVRSQAAFGLVAAMLFYNLTAAGVLAWSGLSTKAAGALLWPAVVLHMALTAWCILSLRLTR